MALARSQRDAQASLPTKTAPPLKRRFESSLAHRLLARAHALSAQSGPSPRDWALTARPRGARARETKPAQRACSSPPPAPRLAGPAPAVPALCGRADEPRLLIQGHPKPYGYIRRCRRDAFLSERKTSCETPACELHRCEGARGEILGPMATAHYRRHDPDCHERRPVSCFLRDTRFREGLSRGIQTEFWPFPRR